MYILKLPENDKQSFEDKFSIKELIEFERFCRDNALWEEMEKCFTSDSKINISWFTGSAKDFIEASGKMEIAAPHKLNNTLVWIKGNKSVAITMATIQCRYNLDGNIFDLESHVKLLYRVQRIDNIWKIISMEGIYEKDILIPVNTNKNISIPKEEISKFRESYAYLGYVLNKSGHKINNNLPGIDKPELIQKLYKEADNWIKSN